MQVPNKFSTSFLCQFEVSEFPTWSSKCFPSSPAECEGWWEPSDSAPGTSQHNLCLLPPDHRRVRPDTPFHQCAECVELLSVCVIMCWKAVSGKMDWCSDVFRCVEMFWDVLRCVEMSTSTLPQLPQTEPSTSRTKFIIFQLQLSQKQFSYCEQIPIPVDFLTFSREELLHLSKHSSLKMLKILDVAIF